MCRTRQVSEMLTSEINKYNKLRDNYANKLKTRHQHIGIRVAPSQPCTPEEEAYVEGHVAPRRTCGVNIVFDESVPGVERRCDGLLSSSSTHCNRKYTEVNAVAFKERLSSFNVALDGVNQELIIEHGRRRAAEV